VLSAVGKSSMESAFRLTRSKEQSHLDAQDQPHAAGEQDSFIWRPVVCNILTISNSSIILSIDPEDIHHYHQRWATNLPLKIVELRENVTSKNIAYSSSSI